MQLTDNSKPEDKNLFLSSKMEIKTFQPTIKFIRFTISVEQIIVYYSSEDRYSIPRQKNFYDLIRKEKTTLEILYRKSGTKGEVLEHQVVRLAQVGLAGNNPKARVLKNQNQVSSEHIKLTLKNSIRGLIWNSMKFALIRQHHPLRGLPY